MNHLHDARHWDEKEILRWSAWRQERNNQQITWGKICRRILRWSAWRQERNRIA